jgi:hypothetical protein
MQDNLNHIYDWTGDWKVFLNEIKFKVLYLGTMKQLENKYKYFINKVEVSESLEKNDLGILFPSDMNWDRQIIKICSSVTFYSI